MNRLIAKCFYIYVLSVAVLVAPLAATAQTTGPPPFFPFLNTTPSKPASKPVFPWLAPTQQAPRQSTGFALPWSQPRQRSTNPFATSRGGVNPFSVFSSGNRGFNPFASGSAGFNPFAMGATSGYGGAPLSSGLGMMTAPMMQGAVGIMAPFAVNYMIASMNPTTMSTFFGLMTQPNSFGFGGFNPMGFGRPMGFGHTSQPTFPFMPPQRKVAPTFPFMPAPRSQQRRQPATAPAFPFNPFSFVGK